jgi:peptidyl-prolyl cis-trans isomerase C
MRKLFVLVMAFFLMVSCAPKEEEKKAAKEQIAKIGDKIITKDDIQAIPEAMRQMYLGAEGLERFIVKQILYQEALKKGIDKDPEYLKMVDYWKKKLLVETLLNKEITEKIIIEDKEVAEYYEKNKERFKVKETGQYIPLDSIKEGLRRQLLMEKQKVAFDKYIADLKERYKVEINVAAEPAGK